MRQIYYYRLGSIAARLGCYAVRAGLKLRAAVALPPIFTVKSFAEKENVTEKLKANNPMLWVQKMNYTRNRAMEIVNSEVVYA